jgi:alpha-ribazole phosphatase
MNLYLVRHTKVKVTAGICYGDTDVGVKSSFPEEAKELKYRLNNIRFTHCFSSP